MTYFDHCRYFLLLLLGVSYISSYGQEYKVTMFQVAQGLPTNLTKSIIKDDKGFVWIGTDAGLMRFDGKNVVQYKKEVLSPYFKSFAYTQQQLYAICDQSITLLENQIDTVLFTHLVRTQGEYSDTSLFYPKTIYTTQKGVLWISEPRSVAIWDGKRHIKRYPFPEKYHTSSFLRAFSFAEDEQGNLYVASQQGFLFLYNPTKDRFIELDISKYKIGVISGLCSAGSNRIWVAGQTGLYEVKVGTNYATTVRQLAPISNVSIIKPDKLGNYFVGTWNNGLYQVKIQGEDIVIHPLTQFKPTVVNDIYITPDNQEIWVSTDEGIGLLRLSLFASTTFPYQRQYIQDIVRGKTNDFYVTDAAKVYHFTVNESPFINAKAIHHGIAEVPQDDILCLTYQKDTLYFATTKGFLYRYTNNRLIDSLRSSLVDNTTIFHLTHDSKGNIWACKDEVLLRITPQRKIFRYSTNEGLTSRIIVTYVTTTDEVLVGGIQSKGYLFRYNPIQDKFENISVPVSFLKEAELVINDIYRDSTSTIWLASNYGLLRQQNNHIEQIDLGKNYDIKSLVMDTAKQVLWLGTDLGIVAYNYQTKVAILYNETDGLPSKTVSFRGLCLDQRQRLWIATAQGLGFIQPTSNYQHQTAQPILLMFRADDDVLHQNYHQQLSVEHGHSLELRFASLEYPADNVLYQYRILGVNEKWSEPSKDGKLIIPQVTYGNYVLEVRALQDSGATPSQVLEVPFVVQKPWFLAWWAIILYLLVLGVLLWVLVKANTQRLKQKTMLLEEVITKRTQEIQQQKIALEDTLQVVNRQKEEIHTNLELLKQQAEELSANVELVEQQNAEIEQKNHAIISSINYALRIQRAILPSIPNYEKTFGKDNFFILYKPKDIVSGDFYWFGNFLDEIIVVVADCTGHGVPGAFMTLLSSELLFEIVQDKAIVEPSQVLSVLDVQLKRVLKHHETEVNDGLDIAICVIDFTTQELMYSGAMIPLYYCQSQHTELQTLLPNKHVIGGQSTKEKVFTTQVLTLDTPTHIYLCTDGYQDQFGGKERRKFLSKNLKKLLFSVYQQPMKAQKEVLDEVIETWKYQSNTKQIDDILIVGLQL